MKEFGSQEFRDELAKTVKQAPKEERRTILDKAREKREEHLSLNELRNFNELSGEQLEELRKRIEKSKGRIIAFIHPYYREEDSVWTDIGSSNPEDLTKMRSSLPTLLSAQNENSPPILIFHDADKLKELEDTLKEVPIEITSYVIPTLSHDPTPTNGKWEDLLKKLKDLGATDVIMAGMNLVIKWPDDGDPKVAGCLADAAQELSKEFKITISKFVYPNTREDYAEFKGPKGPEDHKF